MKRTSLGRKQSIDNSEIAIEPVMQISFQIIQQPVHNDIHRLANSSKPFNINSN